MTASQELDSAAVEWDCTGSPCPWGEFLTGNAVEWPSELSPIDERMGYSVSAAVYVSAAVAVGMTITIVSGSASVFAGLPTDTFHQILAVLAAGQSHTFSDPGEDQIVSVQNDFAPFTYLLDLLPGQTTTTTTTEPETTEPTIPPTTTNPATTQPATTAPPTTQPPATDPVATDPPANTVPETTAPAGATTTTEPPATPPTASSSSATTTTTQPAVPECTDPLSCDVVTSILSVWRCNVPGCTAEDWAGSVIGWPSWSAYESNGRQGDNSRTVHSDDDEVLYPYMGAWADGCSVTVVFGTVVIFEMERGADTWRETVLSPGETYVISLQPPEDSALIATLEESATFGVQVENCTPQEIDKT